MNKLKLILILLITCITYHFSFATELNLNSQQDLVNQGTIAFQKQDYIRAKKLLLKAANKGNAMAQLGLGILYWQGGNGVEQDFVQSRQWLLKSAKQNNATAENLLGKIYQDGKGVKIDLTVAYSWYLKSANQGNDVAQYNLALMYGDIAYKNRGNQSKVVENTHKSIEWALKSANQNNVDAQLFLGGVASSISSESANEVACVWYKRAAEQNSNEGVEKVKSLHCT